GGPQEEELPVRTAPAQPGPLRLQLDLPDTERSDEVPRCVDRKGPDQLSGRERDTFLAACHRTEDRGYAAGRVSGARSGRAHDPHPEAEATAAAAVTARSAAYGVIQSPSAATFVPCGSVKR